MNFFKRFFGHLHTISRHRRMVRRLCFKCGLYWQGLTHDLSKYSPIEFWNGVKYYTGTASPHIGERKAHGYSEAWIHHHNHNKHHAEYWHDIGKSGKDTPITMPSEYLLEMICDRVAAAMIYLGDNYSDASPFEYYKSHKDENQFDNTTRDQLECALHIISRDGFDMFAMLWASGFTHNKKSEESKKNDET